MNETESGVRTDAVRALEAEFEALQAGIHRRIASDAGRLHPGLLPAAYKVFVTIVRLAPITSSALAEVLTADKGQISRTVRELEELGLIRRTPDPRDGRASLLAPSDEGLRKLEALRGPQEQGLLSAVSEWSVSDIENLTRLLHALGSNVVP